MVVLGVSVMSITNDQGDTKVGMVSRTAIVILAASGSLAMNVSSSTASDPAWLPLGSGTGNNVESMTVDGIGNVYIGGAFTTAGGESANRVAKWNGTSWSALGGGMNSTVRALAVSGTTLYAAGAFTQADSQLVNYVAKWDGTSWSPLSTGMDRQVFALAVDGSGNLFAGGDFTTAGGVPVNQVAKWNGTSWSALGSGMDNSVRALAFDASGNLHAGGFFDTAGGVTVNRVAKWNGTSWSALSTGMDGNVYSLAFDGSGNLFAGGDFANAGGTSAAKIAKWSGTSWSALGTGMPNGVTSLFVDCTGILYAGGRFLNAGGTPAVRVAKWDGSTWSAMGSGFSNVARAFSAVGTSLFAVEDFSLAGDDRVNHVARWEIASCETGSSSGVNAPAPVLQQFVQPATGTCTAAAPESLNWAQVPSGGWGVSWSQWANDGRGGAVCSRTLAYSTSANAWFIRP